MQISELILTIRHERGKARIPLVAEALRVHADYLESSMRGDPFAKDVPSIGRTGKHKATKEVTILWRMINPEKGGK